MRPQVYAFDPSTRAKHRLPSRASLQPPSGREASLEARIRFLPRTGKIDCRGRILPGLQGDSGGRPCIASPEPEGKGFPRFPFQSFRSRSEGRNIEKALFPVGKPRLRWSKSRQHEMKASPLSDFSEGKMSVGFLKKIGNGVVVKLPHTLVIPLNVP